MSVLTSMRSAAAPYDPATLAAVGLLMMSAIGIVACWIPALRAARIDPAIAMRA
jgi:putative ABC transport system permease protein